MKTKITKRWVATWLLCAVVSGCAEKRDSLHEMDHVVPAHWPTDLADAAEKLSARFRKAETESADAKSPNSAASREFADIVGWVPQIAADTDMSEQEWNKVFAASETVRLKLKQTSIEKIPDSDVQQLCDLLRQSHLAIQEKQRAERQRLGIPVSEESTALESQEPLQ